MRAKIVHYVVLLIVALLAGCTQDINTVNLKQSDLPTKVDQSNQLQIEKEERNVHSTFKTFFSSTEMKEDHLLIHFGLQNVSGKDLWISQGSQQYEILITNQNNEEVYKFANNQVFTQELMERELKKDGKILFTEKWNLKGNDDSAVPSGLYNININILIQKCSENNTLSPKELFVSSTVEL